MKKFLPFSLFLCVSVLICADDLLLSEPSFSPSRFFIGDKVEMRVSFSTPSNSKLNPPSNLPEFERAKIVSINVIERIGSYELIVDFIPYYSGTLQFPPINLGAVSIEGLSAYVVKLVDGNQNLAFELANQESNPFTFWIFIAQALLWISLPIFGILGTKLLFNLYKKNRKILMLRLPLKDFETNMHHLLQNSVDTVHQYRELTDGFKNFIESRFKIRARGATNTELLQLLSPFFYERQDLQDELAHILSTSDQVKFAGLLIDTNTSHAHVLRLTEAARILEEISMQIKRDEFDAV